MLTRLIESRWTYTAIRLIGLSLLCGYLAISGDLQISLAWAFVFSIISFSLAFLIVGLRLRRRYPKLDRYYLQPHIERSASGSTGEEGALRKINYLIKGFQGSAILSAPAEDGLICVPVLLVGISMFSTSLAGLAFGLIHLGRYTYLECIAKAVIYAFVCAFILPHGLLTVVLGHLILDGFALVMLLAAKRELSNRIRSST